MALLACLCVEDRSLVKRLKSRLEQLGALAKRKIESTEGGIAVYTTRAVGPLHEILGTLHDDPLLAAVLPHVTVVPYAPVAPSPATLAAAVTEYGVRHRLALTPTHLATLPLRWSLYPPMVLLPPDSFAQDCWTLLGAETLSGLYTHLLDSFFSTKLQRFTHLARNMPIVEHDVMRRPFQLVPMAGDFGPEPTQQLYDSPLPEDLRQAFWCHVVQNGVWQTWAPRYTMFSRGNIKEKHRVLTQYPDVDTTTLAVDMYAGIGYFTLSYLARGATVACWEINPWLIEGLIRGAAANGHRSQVVRQGEPFALDPHAQVYIFHESNVHAPARFAAFSHTLRHINLGLLPSSRDGWQPSAALVQQQRHSGRTQPVHLHVHMNVGTGELGSFMETTAGELASISQLPVRAVHLEQIKTFAPDVWHVCGDFTWT